MVKIIYAEWMGNLADKVIEIAMPFSRAEALNKATGQFNTILEHLVKLAVYGDESTWKKTIANAAEQIFDMELRGKKKLTRKDLMECAGLPLPYERVKRFIDRAETHVDNFSPQNKEVGAVQEKVTVWLTLLVALLDDPATDFYPAIAELFHKFPLTSLKGVDHRKKPKKGK